MLYIAYALIVTANIFYAVEYRAKLLHKYHTRALDYCQAVNQKAIIAGTYDSSGFGGYDVMFNRSAIVDFLMLHKWTFKQFYPTLN